MKYVEHNILVNNLGELMSFMNGLPPIIRGNNLKELEEYLSIENKVFLDMNIDQINFYLEAIQEKLNIKGSKSLVSDLTTIYSDNLILERLYVFLDLVLHIKLKSVTKDEFSKELFNALQQDYFISNDLEYEFREIFNYLLKKHIDASSKMEYSYINQLSILRDNLLIKYIGMGKNPFKSNIKDVPSYVIEDYKDNWLDMKIKEVIDILLSINDDELENETIYAYAMSHQILLRSLFVILDDYKRLADYEEYYMMKCPNKTTSRSIITSAFIENYHDINEYSLRKVNKD